ncbi:MAG: DUF502 domain-containing protein [Phycisphaeraceae bacterium]
MTPTPATPPPRSKFRLFFVRGLAILLPTVLTIWILLAAYQFLQDYIAQPINSGIRELVVQTTPWPAVSEKEIDQFRAEDLPTAAWAPQRKVYQSLEGQAAKDALLAAQARREKLNAWWDSYSPAMDLIGLAVAVILIYSAGVLVGSFIGRRLVSRGEELLYRVPLVRRVYPAVKQVTDFFVGQNNEQLNFNRVVAVEYPRKGIWSVGLVTGETMHLIQQAAGAECLTVFVPSSPTPFTGYVITVPKADTIDLPITIEEAVKFALSGGVLIPPSQKIGGSPRVETGNGDELPASAGLAGDGEAESAQRTRT